jgi:hypothetical protein
MTSSPTIIELPFFSKVREKHMNDQGFRELQSLLISEPGRGDVIKGSGGVRKVRFKSQNRATGKRSGIRVIYLWVAKKERIYLLWIIDKADQSDLTPQQSEMMREIAETIKGVDHE